MDPAALVVMLVVGAVAGWLASIVVGGLKYGLIGYIVAGLLGSVVGGWLLNALKIGINLGHPLVNTIITSAIGAIVVILIARMIG